MWDQSYVVEMEKEFSMLIFEHIVFSNLFI